MKNSFKDMLDKVEMKKQERENYERGMTESKRGEKRYEKIMIH